MTITGVTQTAPVLPQTQGAAQSPEMGQMPESPVAAEAMNMSMAVSVQVLDMAQSFFEDAAQQLIDTMSAMTGVGQNVDMTV